MPHNRYYIDAPLALNESVTLSGDEWHHLTRVSRSRKGDVVELVNGKGQLAEASICDLRKNDAELLIETVTQKPSPPPLILAQAIPRMNHLEWIIEKGTELGATAFWLFPGNLSEKETLSPNQLARLGHLCISAMKQCGRLDLPEILLMPSLAEWKPMQGTLLFGDTEEDAPYLWDLSLIKPLPSPVFLFIGPEKGFDPKEVRFMQTALNAKGVKLHPNILRAETAPLAALALMQQWIT